MNEQANEILTDSSFNKEEIEEQIYDDYQKTKTNGEITSNADKEKEIKNTSKNSLIDKNEIKMNYSNNIDLNSNEKTYNKEHTSSIAKKNKLEIPKIRKNNEILNHELNF